MSPTIPSHQPTIRWYAVMSGLAFGLFCQSFAAPGQAAARASGKPTAGSVPAPKPAAQKQQGPLDTATVRKYYLDGDFDPAIDLIETTLRYKSGFSHTDSVFMFKHLGVMYAAKYDTREKGKHYMHRLLEVEPTARILDMYASDMIYMIFKNIQDEFDAARPRPGLTDSAFGKGPGTGPGSGSDPDRPPSKRGGSLKLAWIGAAAAAVAGAATWYYFSDEPKTTTVDHNPD